MFYIVIYGFFNKTDVYEDFLSGVKEGFKIVIKIAPTMVALLVSIGIFRVSGALDFVSGLLEPVGRLLRIPAAVLPVFLVRIFLHRRPPVLCWTFLKNMVRIPVSAPWYPL